MFLKALLTILLVGKSVSQIYRTKYNRQYENKDHASELLPVSEESHGYYNHVRPSGYYSHENRGDKYHGENYYKPWPYKFGYKAYDPKYGSTHHREEVGDGAGSVKGSYGYTDDKGMFREVEYIADKGGFRAAIKTNEPGTSRQHPADVHMESSY